MSENEHCACDAAPSLVFSCSGAADVGLIADRAARRLSGEGCWRMYCLAGIGGRVSSIMEGTSAAANILAIDGCDQDCAKHCLEQAGFSGIRHLRVTDLGMKKGEAAACTGAVARVVAAGTDRMLID